MLATMRSLAIVGVLGGIAVAGVSQAQQPDPQDTAAARAAFADGTALANRGDWAAAADRFGRSLALRPAPATRYNYAGALTHLGRLVEAAEELRTVLRETRPDDRARASAEELLEQVEPRIGRLLIRIAGDPVGAQVTLDGRPMSAARIGFASPVDPGRHRVVLSAGGRETSREVVVGEGGSIEVELALVLPTPSPTSPPVPAAGSGEPRPVSEPPSPVVPPASEVARTQAEEQSIAAPVAGSPLSESGGSILGRWWFWTGAGAVFVGGIVAGVLIANGSGGTAFVLGNSNPGRIEVP